MAKLVFKKEHEDTSFYTARTDKRAYGAEINWDRNGNELASGRMTVNAAEGSKRDKIIIFNLPSNIDNKDFAQWLEDSGKLDWLDNIEEVYLKSKEK